MPDHAFRPSRPARTQAAASLLLQTPRSVPAALTVLLLLLLAVAARATAQAGPPAPGAERAPVAAAATAAEVHEELRRQNDFLRHRLDQLARQVDDLMFFQRLGDLAEVELVRLTGPALRHHPNRRNHAESDRPPTTWKLTRCSKRSPTRPSRRSARIS